MDAELDERFGNLTADLLDAAAAIAIGIGVLINELEPARRERACAALRAARDSIAGKAMAWNVLDRMLPRDDPSESTSPAETV